MIGTYGFQSGFYGLTDMPAEFQKALDNILMRLNITYCFLDDILIVSKGSEDYHKQYALYCLKRLDVENLRIDLSKCNFVNLEIDWLGYHISQSGISPIESKTSAFLSLEAHFVRKPNTPLSVICTKSKLSKLAYTNIENYYLDEDKITPKPSSLMIEGKMATEAILRWRRE